MNKLLALPPRFLAALLVSGSLALGAGVPAQLTSADEGNTQNVQQNQVELPGTATSSTGGAASSGAALALVNAIVHQINVQVAAGDPLAIANSSQTANNNANVTQTSIAGTGDASGSNGGIASSGSAVAVNTATILQINIQIMALLAPTCTGEQVASNDASVDQTAVAASGDASADGSGSIAQSGLASARNRALIIQRNIQIYVCTGRGELSSSVQQQADNTFAQNQAAVALTGTTEATGGSSAGSGRTGARLRDIARQANRQIIIN